MKNKGGGQQTRRTPEVPSIPTLYDVFILGVKQSISNVNQCTVALDMPKDYNKRTKEGAKSPSINR